MTSLILFILKENKRRILSWVCFICMLFNTLPVASFASEFEGDLTEPVEVVQDVMPDDNDPVVPAVQLPADPVDSQDPSDPPADTVNGEDPAVVDQDNSQEAPAAEEADISPDSSADITPDEDALEPDTNDIVPEGQDTPSSEEVVLPSLFIDFPATGVFSGDTLSVIYKYTSAKNEELVISLDNIAAEIEVKYLSDEMPVEAVRTEDEETGHAYYRLSALKDEVYLIRVFVEKADEEIPYSITITEYVEPSADVEPEVQDIEPDNTGDALIDIPPEITDNGSEETGDTTDTEPESNIVDIFPDLPNNEDTSAFDNFLNDNTEPAEETPADQNTPADSQEEASEELPVEPIGEEESSADDEESLDSFLVTDENTDAEQADSDVKDEEPADEEQPATDGEENTVSDEDAASSTDETEDVEDSSVNTEEDGQENQEADILKEDSDEDSEASEETEDNADKDSEEGNDESAETEDEDKSEETAEDDADLEIDEETLICEDGIYTYTGHGLTVSVETSEENELPEGSEFVLIPVSAEEPRVQEYVARVAEMHGVDPESVTPYVYDMHFEYEGEEVQIAKETSVNIRVSFDEALNLGGVLAAPFYHAENGELVELIADVARKETPALRGAKMFKAAKAAPSDEKKEEIEEKTVDSFSFAVGSFSDFMLMGVGGTRSVDKYEILYSNGDLVIQEGNTTDPNKGTVVRMELCTDGTMHAFYANYKSSIKNVYFNTTINRTSGNGMFYQYPNLENIYYINNVIFSGSATLNHAFRECPKLKHIDGLDIWDVSMVTQISSLFNKSPLIDNINDIEGWNLTIVPDAYYGVSWAFADLPQLTSLDLSGWDLSQVFNTENMFYRSTNLQTVNLGNLFAAVPSGTNISMRSMFMNCSSLTNVNGFLTNAPASCPIDLNQAFDLCSAYNTEINLSGTTITNMSYAFCQCQSLPSVDLSGCSLSGPADRAFQYCDALTTINLSNIQASTSSTNLDDTFYKTPSLTYLDLSSTFFDDGNKSSTFLYNSGITSITLGSNYIFGNSELKYGTWERESTGETMTASELKANYNSSMADTYLYIAPMAILYSNGDLVFQSGDTIDESRGSVVTSWGPDGMGCFEVSCTRNLVKQVYITTNIRMKTSSMFSNLNNLEYMYGVEKIDLSNIASLSYFLSSNQKLKHVYGLADMDTSCVTNVNSLFSSDSSLDNINDIEGWTIALKGSGLNAAFQSCTQLTSIDLSGWDLSQLTSIQGCFSSCSSLQSVDLGNIFTDCTSGNTMSNIRITLGSAFFNCLNLTSLNDILSNIPRTSNISAVDICQIFASCSKLNIPINLSELPLDNIYGAFSNCHSLQSVDMSGCIMPRTNTGAYNLFYCCYALETVNFENTTVINAASTTRSVFQNTRSLSYLDLTNGFFDRGGKNAEFFKNSGITRISLGSGFKFESSILPPGIWERESTGEQYSAAELKNIWDSSMADTYFLADLTDYDNKYAIIYSNGDMVFQETNILDPSKGTALWVWLCDDGLFDDRWSRPDMDSNSSTTAMTKYKEAVKRVYFNTTIGATPGKSFDFRSCENLEYIYNIERLDLSNNPNGTRGMFWDCKKLVHVYGLADMDVSNVHQCEYMFNNCNNLENINDIEGWNLTITNNSLISVFSGCHLLETIDLSSWDLSNVSNIQNMFNACSNIRSVDLGNIFTSATANINMSNTFQYCYSLESISDIISNIPANKTVSLAGTYNYCYSLTSVIDLSGLTITDLNFTFNNCKEIKEIYLTGCTLSGGANSAFSNCNSLRILDLNNVTATASSTSLNTTFQNTYVLAYLDLSSKYFDGGSKGSTTFSGSAITKVKLGSGFQFNSSTLPAGNWKRESTGDVYTAAQLKSAWNSSMADTYEKVNVVTFDGMGGTVSQKKISKSLGENIDEDDLPVAELTGYTFLGWFTDQTAGTELHVGDPVAQSIYYAHWQENEYTLALCRNATDETGNIETDIVLTYTETYRLPPDLYQNDDKVIQKWSTSSDGSGTSYSPDETVSMLSTADNGEVYLYAIWGRSQQATISFDSQGGNDVESIVVERGGTLTTTQYPTPARSGYVFQGWWTDPTDGERWDTEDRTILGSQQLYAHWSQNLTVSFVSNGWISESTLSVPYGETLSSLPWGSDAPRVLAGFFTDPDFGEGTKLTTSTVITEDSVYYAHWGYQPNFVLNGGAYTNGYSVDTEYPISDSNLIEITSLPTVEYDGHTLNRWKLSDGTTVNIGDVIDMTVYPDITAEWDRTDTVKVTFDPNGGTLSTDKYEDATKYLATVYELEKDTPLGYYPDAYKYVSSKSYRLQFLGWYDDNDVLYTRDTVVTQDVTLHAKYMSDNIIKYEFLVAGSTITPVSQYGNTIMTVSGYKAIVIHKTKGDTFGVPPGVSANIAGKYLEGWYSDPDPYNQDGTLKDGVVKLTSQTANTEDSRWYAYFADETETKHSDNISYKFYADWTNTASSATLTNTDKNLDFHPTSTSNLTANLHAHFELLSSVSETLPVGSVRITIPKYVWKDWDGNDVGTVNISSQLPQYPNKKSGMLFSYAEDGEGNYVLLNNVPLSGGAGVDVTLAYTVNPLLVPGGATDRNKDYLPEYPYYSATIPVTMEIDRDIVTEYEQTTTNGIKTVTLTDNFVPDVQDDDSLSLELHTLVDTSLVKSLYGWYYEWQDAWGPRPDDYQDNFYIEWRVTMSRKNNQPFTWKITEDTVHDGTVVSGPTYANGPESVTTGTGTYSDSYVNFVIAYPKSLYDDMPAAGRDLLNQAKLTVEWKSGYVQELVASATQHISSWKSSYGEFSKSNVYGSSQSYTPYVFGNYDAAGNKENLSDKYKQNMLVNGEIIPLEWELTYDGTSTDQPILWDEDSGSYVRSQRIIAIADGMNGDIMYSSGKTYNKYVWEPSSGNKVLTDEDYRINKIRIYLNEYDGSLHNGEWGGPTLRSDYGVWKDIGVYVRYVNSNDLVFYKSVRPYATQVNDVGTTFQNGYTDVVFPANVVGWEIRYPTKYFKTKIKVHEIVEILPTANLRSWIQEDIIGGYNSLIKNRGYCNIWSSDDEYADPGNWNRRYSTNSYDNSTRAATDIFFHATNWKGGFNKANQAIWELKYDKLHLYAYKYTSSQNQVIFDAGQGVQDSVVQITGKNYNPRSNFSVASISAGRFYDLLPRGTTVDVGTLFGILSRNTNSSQNNNCANYSTLKENTSRHLPKEYYNVEFVEDWEGSGRTMMIIDYTAPTDDTNTAEFYYLLRTTYDDILTYGASMQNDVAFVDLTQSNAYDSYYSARSYLQNDSYLYENIDLLYDNIAYYYANANYILVNAFSWGFFKTVNTDDSYSDHEVTIPNNIYTYKLNYTQSELTKTQSMVFFDVLDRGTYDNAFTDPQLSTPTEWSGTFDSIDITPLQSLVKDGSSASNPIYCAPVVYYSTKAKDAFTSSDWDVTNTATWTTTMPDKSLITAVAVDCSKAANGTDFVMKGVNNAVFYVRMVSSADPDDIDKAAVNQAMFKAVVNDLPNEALSSASVTIIDMTPEIHKTSSPTSGTQEAPQALMPGEKLVYTLTATNTNTEFTVPNVVIEDELSTDLQMEADKILIHFGNAENAMPVSSSPRAIMRITGSRIKITINTLQPEETCYITIPARARAAYGHLVENTAVVTSVNGVTTDIESETTYHKINNQIPFLKLSSNGSFVIGATLQLWNTDGADNVLVEEWETANEPHNVCLDAGNYLLTETAVPDGYSRAADMTFEVQADGTVVFPDTTTASRVVMVDEAVVPIHGTKTWKYDAPEDRPASITICLMRKLESDTDFTYTGNSQVVTDNDNWEYDFGNQPRYDLNGDEYTYSIEENPVTGYTPQYLNGNPDANGLQITFNARTSTYDSNDKFTLYYRYEDKVFGKTYYGAYGADTNPAGTTIQIPTNEFWIAFESDNANNDYGFKLDQIVPVQMSNAMPTLERITPPAWTGTAVSEEYSGGRYPESDHNYFVSEQILMHYMRTMEGGSYDVMNIKDSIGFNIPINKVNEDNEKIGGVSLRLTSDPQPGDPEIEPIEWVTEAGETHYVHLYPGHYVLHEVSAVTGYLLADDIAFEVNGQGGIIIDNTELNTLEMLDRYSSQPYPIKKVWMDEGFESRRPASLTFELVRRSDNTVVGTKTLTAEDAASSTVWEGEFDPVPVVDNSNNQIEYFVRETNTLSDYVKVYGLEHVNGFNVTFTADSDIGDGRLYIVLLDSTQETPLEDLQMEGHLTLNPLYGMAYLEGDDMAGNTYYIPNRSGLNAIGFYVEWPNGTSTGSLDIASIVPTEETHSYTLATSGQPYTADWSALQNVTMNSAYPNLTARQAVLGNNVSGGVWYFDMYQSETNFDGSAVVNMIRRDITYEYPVTFSKVKPDNTMLAGAHLKLCTSEETLVSEWDTSASEAHTENLAPGEYILKETGVPAGYLKAADIAFTVANDGTILVNSTSVQGITMTDALQPTLSVDVVDYDHRNTSLTGASLRLYDSEGETLLTWISDGTLKDVTSQLQPGHTYTIRELTPPAGYNALTEDIHIQVASDGTITITASDWAELTGNATSGYVLKLLNRNGILFPATGSSDIPIYAAGLLLMIMAMAMVIAKRRQKA